MLLKPRSRGSVRLRSADPAEPPRIDLPGVREPSDVDQLPEIRGADQLRTFVRENSYSVPHVVGTCAMGPSRDEGAVVDPTGRVHGTEGLFVADASIMPDVPSGFPHVATIMIAERLSEMMLVPRREGVIDENNRFRAIAVG